MEFSVKVLMTFCTLSMLGALAGCAGPSADVRASGDLGATDLATATYRLARTPAQAEANEPLPYEALLRAGLAQRGFKEGTPEAARYIVSAAWASRPSDVSVETGGSGNGGDCVGGCVPSEGPSFPWFGKRYTHTLTLRFLALPDGREAYKVSAVKRDRNADAQQALPYLVAGALARLPYAGALQWRVKLKEADHAAAGQAGAPAMPDVISIKPLAQ